MTDLLAASPFARALGQSLVQFVWQGAAIAAIVGALLMMLRRSSPQARYLVAVAGLAAMAAAPAITIVSTWRDAPAVMIDLQLQPIDATATLPAIPAAGTTLSAWLDAQLPLIVVTWCAGVLLLTVHLIGGWWRLTRIARRAAPIVTGRLAATLPAIAGRLGVVKKVRLVESALVRVPSVIGWIRPVVVLPVSALAGLPPAHLDAILAHELAHVRRGDFVVNLVQCVVETLLFYHPAVWWVSRRIRVEREQCCDDMAAALSPTRAAYARALTSLEELQHRVRPVAVAATGGELLQRIRRLLDPPVVRSRWSGGLAMIVVLTVLLMSAGGQTLPASDELPTVPRSPVALVDRQSATSDQQRTDARALYDLLTSQTGRGAVAGHVRDVDGGAIPGAAVTITSPTFERSVITDSSGVYRLADLPFGSYELTVRLTGFSTARHRLQIVANETVADIRLQVGRLTESVHVAGALPAGVTVRPTPPWPSTAADYFDAAKIYYQQGRLSDAEAATARALELMRAGVPEAPGQDPRIDPGNPVRIGGDIVAPKILKRMAPEYPPAALAAGIEGTVLVEAQIQRDGRVGNVAVLRSVPGLDEAALAAVRQWVFTPTLLNRVPVVVAMTVSVTFTAK
jgi:TonB family protein